MPEEKGKAIPVMVALRCRPLIQREIREGCQPCLHMVSGEPQVVLGKDRPFTYDFAFAATDPQSQVYEVACKKLIQSIFKGVICYNLLLFYIFLSKSNWQFGDPWNKI